MEDAGVRLERLLGHEVTQNRGVGAQHHCDIRSGWSEESGQIYSNIKNQSALAPKYQRDNLYMLVIDMFL